jgi:NADH-quinone oxidoreductase subunit D
VAYARDALGLDFLLDITSLDHCGEEPRWTVVYELYGLAQRCHLRLKTNLPEAKAELPTVSSLWGTAEWHEREIYDMMGLQFRGHPDLRRILMWEGYPHFPLRKDFPLAGLPTEMPEVAFTDQAPLEGGPFLTNPAGRDATEREPRARHVQSHSAPRPDAAAPPPNPLSLNRQSGTPDSSGRTDVPAADAVRATGVSRGPAPTETAELSGEQMVLNMGPSHPSTHGVLRIVLELDGEVITRASPDVGYLHRGDEKLAENLTYTQFIPYTDRLDYLAPMASNVAYALAVEKLLGIDRQLPLRCQYLRVIGCELVRISSHLLGVGCFAMDVGAMTVFLHTFTEREKIHNLFEALTGARVTTSYTRIGGLARDLPPGWTEACRRFLAEVPVAIDEVEQLLTRNRIWMDRTKDVGVIPRDVAVSYALTGPNLRGSGISYDVRQAHPYLVYDRLQFDVPVGSVGDCYDRYLVRMEEMRQSVRLVHQCLDQLPAGPVNVADGKIALPPKETVLTGMEELIHQFILVTQGVNVPPGEVYFGAENPKGELGFYIHSRGGGTPYRLKIRAPSFVNLSVLPRILPGHMISDVVSILGSLDFVMGECDR